MADLVAGWEERNGFSQVWKDPVKLCLDLPDFCFVSNRVLYFVSDVYFVLQKSDCVWKKNLSLSFLWKKVLPKFEMAGHCLVDKCEENFIILSPLDKMHVLISLARMVVILRSQEPGTKSLPLVIIGISCWQNIKTIHPVSVRYWAILESSHLLSLSKQIDSKPLDVKNKCEFECKIFYQVFEIRYNIKFTNFWEKK